MTESQHNLIEGAARQREGMTGVVSYVQVVGRHVVHTRLLDADHVVSGAVERMLLLRLVVELGRVELRQALDAVDQHGVGLHDLARVRVNHRHLELCATRNAAGRVRPGGLLVRSSRSGSAPILEEQQRAVGNR